MEISQEVLTSLRRIIRSVDLYSKQVERQSGLTGPQLLVMRQIAAQRGAATAGAIARDISLSQATVTAIIDRLERKGLLQRERDSKDKR